MNFAQTLVLAEAIDYPHLLSVQDVTWSRDDESIYWVDSHNNVYSSHMTEGSTIQNDMFIFNADTGCGYWLTHIFQVSKEITYNKFEETYEEFM